MAWNWLISWWRNKKRPRPEVVLYTREGCHLCEQAWRQLEEARRRFDFALRQVDIDADPRLQREYGECVPVVTIEGRVRFRGAVNGVLLQRMLSHHCRT